MYVFFCACNKQDTVCPVGFGSKKNPAELLKKTSCSSTDLETNSSKTASTQNSSPSGVWNSESGQHFTIDNVPSNEGLSTKALKSNIPKSGDKENTTWTYPSPQRFYNAMRKKGWEANPEDMATVVAIHNTINERSWQEVMKYEKLFHCDECKDPKLLKFRGRPTDYSLKARFLQLFG